MQEQEDRIIASRRMSEDQEIEYSLRPRRINEYIGQEKVKEQMMIFIQAALERGKLLIMSSCTDRQAWVKLHWRILLMSWVSASGSPLVRQ